MLKAKTRTVCYIPISTKKRNEEKNREQNHNSEWRNFI